MANLLDSIVKFIGNRGVFKDGNGDVNMSGGLAVTGNITTSGNVTDGNGKVLSNAAIVNTRVVGNISYTTSTSWAKAGDVTITEAGIYRVRASYGGAPVLGFAYSLAQYNAIAQAQIISETTTGMSADSVCYFASGAYSFWVKSSVNGKANSIQVTELISLA